MSFIVRSICVLFSVVFMLSMTIGVGLYCELWCFAVVLFLLLLFSLVLLSFVCSCVVVVSIVSSCVVFCVSVLVVFTVMLGGLVLLSARLFPVCSVGLFLGLSCVGGGGLLSESVLLFGCGVLLSSPSSLLSSSS